MTENLLEVRKLCKAFGGVIANDAIDLEVPRGAIVGLIGPNGSGKTTLFNSVVGHHPFDAGSVRFDGRELAHLTPAEIARLGLVRTFQQAHVYDGMTCLQNMQISASHKDEPVAAMFRSFPPALADKALGLLDFVGLGGHRDGLAGSLSYGQRKLLEFAMALMNEPKMLLLDEPTAGVNPTLINSVIDYLKRANESGADSEIDLHMGEVQWAMGDQKAARATWQAALLKAPEDKRLRERLERAGP